MKCRYCDGNCYVASTRTPRGEFYVLRRQVCKVDPTHRFNSVEVLESFIKKLGGGVVSRILQTNQRGSEANRKAMDRRRRTLELIGEGEKQEYIAAVMNMSVANVRKIKSKYG